MLNPVNVNSDLSRDTIYFGSMEIMECALCGHYYYYYYYYKLQLRFHSVAIVLTLTQTKQIRINTHKRNNTKNRVQTIQNTVNTSTHITKTPTHYKTDKYIQPHVTKQVKTTTVQGITK